MEKSNNFFYDAFPCIKEKDIVNRTERGCDLVCRLAVWSDEEICLTCCAILGKGDTHWICGETISGFYCEFILFSSY